MLRLLMLDSGAFSVWSKGAEIDLDAYIQFCHKHPGVSYYVNLDKIPGKPNQKHSLTPTAREEAANTGWNNYHKMLDAGLPIEKVIPVYHQHEDPAWLRKYISFGSPYIGISPANDSTTEGKLAWMRGLVPILFRNSDKSRPVVKTHGFAVTSFSLMNYWTWHSVDSASWKVSAAWGAVYVPRRGPKGWDFSKPPVLMVASPVTLASQPRGKHIGAVTPQGYVQKLFLEWLDYCGVVVGKYETEYVNSDAKLGEDEMGKGNKTNKYLANHLKLMEEQ
jgi:hypothetical protein